MESVCEQRKHARSVSPRLLPPRPHVALTMTPTQGWILGARDVGELSETQQVQGERVPSTANTRSLSP